MPGNESLIPTERIEQAMFLLRGEKVMLSSDLAKLYGVAPLVLPGRRIFVKELHRHCPLSPGQLRWPGFAAGPTECTTGNRTPGVPSFGGSAVGVIFNKGGHAVRKTRLLPVLALLAVVLGRPTPAPSEAREAPERPRKVNGPPGPYLVLVDAGRGDEFLPAAEAMAALHGAALKRFDPAKLEDTLAELRKVPPRFVVFVLPPEKIDIDLAHQILEMAMQVFCHVTDDGLRLGEAAKRMADRLALDFLPGRIHFEPTRTIKDRFSGEGAVNRRHNGAGMIFYGDPALAPFARTAKHLVSAEATAAGAEGLHLRLEVRPQLDGTPGVDFMLPQSRLTDYYSVKTADYAKELALEVYRVVRLPAGCEGAPALRVASARSGGEEVPTRSPQVVVEETRGGKFLHVRVPLAVRVVDTPRVFRLMTKGMVIDLDGKP